MIFHEYSYRRGGKKKKSKKERPNTYLVHNHSNSTEMVLIFNEASWQGIWVADTQTEQKQKQNKNKQRIAKAWTVSLIIIL